MKNALRGGSLESSAQQEERKLQKAKLAKQKEVFKVNLKTLDAQQAKALQLMKRSDSVRSAIKNGKPFHEVGEMKT